MPSISGGQLVRGNWSDRDVPARARCLTVSVAGNDDERHVDREIENCNNFAMTWFRAAGEEIAGKIWWICVFGTQKFSTSLGCSMSCYLGSHSWTVQCRVWDSAWACRSILWHIRSMQSSAFVTSPSSTFCVWMAQGIVQFWSSFWELHIISSSVLHCKLCSQSCLIDVVWEFLENNNRIKQLHWWRITVIFGRRNFPLKRATVCWPLP